VKSSETLIGLDPLHADVYRTRADAYTRELLLTTPRSNKNSPRSKNKIATFHEAWFYSAPLWSAGGRRFEPSPGKETRKTRSLALMDQIIKNNH